MSCAGEALLKGKMLLFFARWWQNIPWHGSEITALLFAGGS